MAKYVDGFVLLVPEDKVEEYKKMASEGRDMWMKAGALEYYECVGEDLAAKEMGGMKPLAFTEMAQAKEGENVWFSFIVYKSREHRDEVNAKVMKEMHKLEEQYKDIPMPFDMKKMAYGGFEVAVEG
ncbi:MAG: RNA signal recognition particle [Deltaproteobacteria bacterium RIFOXYC2_FULL_48_10]|nr:MAG: RNA signal recognition particle [Deltaproteobacteria bacterium RIFOXYC2_FULL_48_10]